MERKITVDEFNSIIKPAHKLEGTALLPFNYSSQNGDEISDPSHRYYLSVHKGIVGTKMTNFRNGTTAVLWIKDENGEITASIGKVKEYLGASEEHQIWGKASEKYNCMTVEWLVTNANLGKMQLAHRGRTDMINSVEAYQIWMKATQGIDIVLE